MELPGGGGVWLAPSPSPSGPAVPDRHDEHRVGTFIWPPAGTSTWPPVGTFSWPRTRGRAQSPRQTRRRHRLRAGPPGHPYRARTDPRPHRLRSGPLDLNRAQHFNERTGQHPSQPPPAVPGSRAGRRAGSDAALAMTDPRVTPLLAWHPALRLHGTARTTPDDPPRGRIHQRGRPGTPLNEHTTGRTPPTPQNRDADPPRPHTQLDSTYSQLTAGLDSAVQLRLSFVEPR
jgi:hypothetical protein